MDSGCHICARPVPRHGEIYCGGKKCVATPMMIGSPSLRPLRRSFTKKTLTRDDIKARRKKGRR